MSAIEGIRRMSSLNVSLSREKWLTFQLWSLSSSSELCEWALFITLQSRSNNMYLNSNANTFVLSCSVFSSLIFHLQIIIACETLPLVRSFSNAAVTKCHLHNASLKFSLPLWWRERRTNVKTVNADTRWWSEHRRSSCIWLCELKSRANSLRFLFVPAACSESNVTRSS